MKFTYTGVTDAFNNLPQEIKKIGVEADTRNGPVIEVPHPIIVELTNPQDRILLCPKRDANPTFHLLEALWMLAGRNDTEFVCTYVKTMANYSDDGDTFHAAYGHRWRNHFGYDQLTRVVQRLKDYKGDRRTVLGMWDANIDLQESNDCKDLPCNMLIKFAIRDKKLNMTVFNRSNDVILGMLGANVVHMSILQEYIASRVGVEVGSMFTVSDNAHLYTDLLKKISGPPATPSEVTKDLFNSPETFDLELKQWMNDWDGTRHLQDYTSNILNIASQLAMAHWYKREYNTKKAIDYLGDQERTPWVTAAMQWYQRRNK